VQESFSEGLHGLENGREESGVTRCGIGRRPSGAGDGGGTAAGNDQRHQSRAHRAPDRVVGLAGAGSRGGSGNS
jgi:hypothetical protein